MQQPNDTSTGRAAHSVVGARAKSVSAPGTRGAGSSPGRSGTHSPSGDPSAPSAVAATAGASSSWYRERLVELYKIHNPTNVAKVDYLLKKYRGQEEFLYRSVCAKYNKTANMQPGTKAAFGSMSSATGVAANSTAGGSTSNDGSTPGKGAAPRVESTANTRPKAVLPRPPSRSSVAAGDAKSDTPGKLCTIANGILPARGIAINTSLLARIDFLLLGDRTGFFERSAGYASSGSAGSSSQSASGSGESSSSGGEEETDARDAGSSTARGTAVGKVPAVAQRAVPSKSATTAAAIAAIAGRGKDAPTAPAELKRVAAPVAVETGDDAARAGDVQLEHADDQHADDSDMSDDMLADALAAKLQAVSSKAPGPRSPPPRDAPETDALPPPSGRARRAEEDLTSDDNGNCAAEAKPTPKSKASAALPPTRSKRNGGDSSGAVIAMDIAAKPKAKASAASPPSRSKRNGGDSRDAVIAVDIAAKPKAKAAASASGSSTRGVDRRSDDEADPRAPPLFDQWLACLKFLVGWNEARPQNAGELKGALREHFREEGIDSARVVDQLCATVVPLLLDVRRIDAAVVKNVRVQVLKGLKTVQVSILRIVAFELCRELDAKIALRKKKADGAKAEKSTAGACYLASDIYSLAKVVQHFRFDRMFSAGLQQLITSIKNQGRSRKNGGGCKKEVTASADAGAKKRKEVAAGKEAGVKANSDKLGASGSANATDGAPLSRKKPRTEAVAAASRRLVHGNANTFFCSVA